MAEQPQPKPAADNEALEAEKAARAKAEADAAAAQEELANLKAKLADEPVDETAKEAKRAAAAQKKRFAEIDSMQDLDDEDKQILKLHEQGMQQFAIAKKVFKFVNQDTVNRVAFTIRKAYATDFDQVEGVESTKGYTGF